MKLLDLLKEDPKQFTSRTQKIDPDTGTITWSIKYNNLKVIDSKLDTILFALERLAENHDDEKLDQLIDTFKKFKKAYRSHITRKYKK